MYVFDKNAKEKLWRHIRSPQLIFHTNRNGDNTYHMVFTLVSAQNDHRVYRDMHVRAIKW